MNNLICWYNNQYVKLSEVNISILDFGFIHSDATYDVMKTKSGKIAFYDMHYNRYENSCNYFGFTPIEHIDEITKTLLDKNQITDAFVWVCNWRGAPPSGKPRDMSGTEHQVIYVKPYYAISDKPISLCVHYNNKRTPDSVVLQHYKNFSWIELTKAQKTADSKGYDTATVLNIDGYISEGPGFGICYVKGDTIYTPQKDVLKSVTIDVVEIIAKSLRLNFCRYNITVNDMLTADEMFICSTSGGITPVYKFETTVYSSTKITDALMKQYNASF